MLDEADRAALRALIDRYEAIWNAQDYAALRSLWAADEEEPWWGPEEEADILVGWPAVERYWRACEALIARFGVRTADRRIKAIAPDVALMIWRLVWTAELRAAGPIPPPPIGGEVKASAVLKRTAEGWVFAHYMEAAQGPLPFVRRAYQARAEPDLLRSPR